MGRLTTTATKRRRHPRDDQDRRENRRDPRRACHLPRPRPHLAAVPGPIYGNVPDRGCAHIPTGDDQRTTCPRQTRTNEPIAFIRPPVDACRGHQADSHQPRHRRRRTVSNARKAGRITEVRRRRSTYCPTARRNPSVAHSMVALAPYSLADLPEVDTSETRRGVMNTYDPADGILYVHMARGWTPTQHPWRGDTPTADCLPDMQIGPRAPVQGIVPRVAGTSPGPIREGAHRSTETF
jgi:hypothetical protein